MTDDDLFLSTDMKKEHEKIQKKKEKKKKDDPATTPTQSTTVVDECKNCGPIERYWVFGHVPYRRQYTHEGQEEGTIVDWDTSRNELVKCMKCDDELFTRNTGRDTP